MAKTVVEFKIQMRPDAPRRGHSGKVLGGFFNRVKRFDLWKRKRFEISEKRQWLVSYLRKRGSFLYLYSALWHIRETCAYLSRQKPWRE